MYTNSIRTLGRLEIAGSSVVQAKLLLLLCYLAIEGPQPRRHLAELFWPRTTDPANRLSVALSRLRRTQSGCVEANANQVWTPLVSDTSSFIALLDAGETDQATALYAGHFLEEFHCAGLRVELEEWIYSTRESLAQRLLRARLAQALALAARGQFGRSARLVEQIHPFVKVAAPEANELEQLYLIALAGGSSLAATLRAELVEIGAEPPESPEAAKAKLRDLAIHSLPVTLNRFSGRETEMASLRGLFHADHSRLITVTGAGGSGKTRLAVEVGRQEAETGAFPDGVFWVAVEHLGSPGELPSAIAEVVGALVIGPQASSQLIAALGDKKMLLILDNLEHLIEGVETLLSALVRGCPHLRILVTSRLPLQLAEEWLLPILGLPYPERFNLSLAQLRQYPAAQLLLDRAIQVNPYFQAHEADASRLAQLCAFVGGSPLALELAASWVGKLGTKELEDMTEHFEIFSSPLRNLPERHRSIKTVLEQSWQMLSVVEQLSLIRLSVFRGGFSAHAALNVAEVAIGTLADLVTKAFLSALPDGRYGQHPLLAQFMAEKAPQHRDDHAQVQRRHAEYFADNMRTWTDTLQGRGSQKQQAVEAIDRDYDNLQNAWQWSAQQREAALVYRMTPGLYAYFTIHAYTQQAFASWALAEEKLDRSNTAHHPALGQLLAARAMTLMFLNLKDQAIAVAQQGMELLRPVTDLWGMRNCLVALAVCARTPEESLRYQTELHRLRDDEYPSTDLNNLSYLKFRLTHYEQAKLSFGEALTVSRQEGNEIGIVFCLYHLGLCDLYTHQPRAAYAWFQQASAFSDFTVSMLVLSDAAQVGMARAALELGDVTAAERAAKAVLERNPPLPFENHKIGAKAVLAAVEQRRGNVPEAAQRCQELLSQPTLLAALSDEHDAFALRVCAQTCADLGGYVIAAELLGYILHHGSAFTFEIDKVRGMLVELEAYLEPMSLAAALDRGQRCDLRAVSVYLQTGFEPMPARSSNTYPHEV